MFVHCNTRNPPLDICMFHWPLWFWSRLMHFLRKNVIFAGPSWPSWPCRRLNFFMICSLKEPLQPARSENMGYCAQSTMIYIGIYMIRYIYNENGTWSEVWRIWRTKSSYSRTFWQRVLSSKKAQSWAEQSVLRKTRKDADNCLKLWRSLCFSQHRPFKTFLHISSLIKSTSTGHHQADESTMSAMSVQSPFHASFLQVLPNS